MTQELSEHLRKISSRNGRYWLRDMRNESQSASDERDELPFQSVQSSQAKVIQHESVVVAIPNVAAARPATAPVAAPKPAPPKTDSFQLGQNAKVVAPLPTVHATPPAPHSLPATIAQTAPAALASVPVASHSLLPPTMSQTEAAPAPAPTPVVTPEPPVNVPDPIDAPDEAVQASRATQDEGTQGSIGKIADEIVKRFPVASSSVIMFAGSQASMHTDETCARVAAELAARNEGRVLLIDSDFTSRRLSKASGMAAQGGLSEIMNIAYPWQDAILKSGSSKLDFMPAGNCPHKRWVPKKQLREAIAEIKVDYQFVCVSVGDAHEDASSTWSEIADGAFLLVSASHSSDAIAESAVAQLRSESARLIGCIVADVDVEETK